MAGLRNVISMYGNANEPTVGTRKDLLLRTMQILDYYQPPLSDQDAIAAILFQTKPVAGSQSQSTEQPLGAGSPVAPTEGQPIITPAASTTLTYSNPPAEGGPVASSEQLWPDPDTTIGVSSTNRQPTGGQSLHADAQAIMEKKGAENVENASFTAGLSGNSTSMNPSGAPIAASSAVLECQQNQVTKLPHDTVDAPSSSSGADQALAPLSTAKAHAKNRNLNIKPLLKGSLESPISVEDTPPIDSSVMVCQRSTSSDAIADDLNRALRRYLLHMTDDRLQPMEDSRSLLPVQNPAANKTIVDEKAFTIVFDDKNDPGIYSVQIEFVQGLIPNKHIYRCSRIGCPLPYRGRGPVRGQNSCHLDCCIVAARLMSVGQTKADLSEQSRPKELKDLTPFQKCFKDVLAIPWETLTTAINSIRRDQFRDQYRARRAELGRGIETASMAAANDSWQVCAEGFGQFEYTVYKQTSCDKCSYISPTPANPPSTGVLEFDAPGPAYWKANERESITELFVKHFDPKPFRGTCISKNCKGQVLRTRIVFGELPQRLVLPTPTIPSDKAGHSPIPKDRDIVGATSNLITVAYQTTTGQEVAYYRWVGGIYAYQRHLRLYWSDRDSGDGDNLMVYDGMKINGSIIGGVPPYSPHNAVPPPWSQGCDVLFYERIYPEKARLNADTIREKIDDILDQEKLPGQKRRLSEKSEESLGSNKKVRNGSSRSRRGGNA